MSEGLGLSPLDIVWGPWIKSTRHCRLWDEVTTFGHNGEHWSFPEFKNGIFIPPTRRRVKGYAI